MDDVCGLPSGGSVRIAARAAAPEGAPGDLPPRAPGASAGLRVRVWISGSQFETWKHTQLVVDAVPGRGSGFSLENPTGKRFLSRARTFDERELAALEEFPPPAGADLDV